MPDFSSLWSDKQFDISFEMELNGIQVTPVRGSTELAEQTVLFAEDTNTVVEVAGQAGIAGTQKATLIGYRDYPGKTTYDAQEEDKYYINGTRWRVTYVNDMKPGRREAHIESGQ